MRTLTVLAALVAAAAAPLAAQEHQHQHADSTASRQGQHADSMAAHMGQHAAPAGWVFRTDRPTADRNAVHFMQMGDALHFMLGPAAIFYNPANTRTGDYRVSAKFSQMRAPEHPEAYGLLLAGSNLDGANQSYIYFIIRGTGEYSIRHRAGEEVHTIVDWTASPAVHAQDAQGKATNELAVDVNATAISALVNGTEVFRMDRAAAGHPINTDGIYGLRVNHNLAVHVSDFQATGH